MISASRSAACRHWSAVTSRCVTARTIRAPKSETSTPRLRGARDNRCGIRCTFLHTEDHDVTLHCRKVEADAAQPDQLFCQQPRVGVILDEPGEVVIERVEAGGSENAGLAHRAAEHAPRPQGAGDVVLAAGDQATDRAARAL